jgi:hypothetical protein
MILLLHILAGVSCNTGVGVGLALKKLVGPELLQALL